MKMKLVLQNGKETVVLGASRDEMNLLAASINEAILAVPDWEFSIRLPGSKDKARGLLTEMNRLLEMLPPEQNPPKF
jgi:hypothetical protein